MTVTRTRTKGDEGNVINSMDSRSPEFRSTAISYTFPAPLCPQLFTALVHDRVNYGEPGFHKFRDEIWSDKFNSQDPAPGSRRARVTRVAHT